MPKTTKTIRYSLLSATLLLALAGCNSGDRTELGDGSRAPELAMAGTASAQFELTLPNDLTTDLVQARLEGPGIDETYDIDVVGSSTVSLFLDGLPPGDYGIELSSTLSDGQVCEGSSAFTVVANQTQLVEVVLECQGAGNGSAPTGSVNITATFDFGDEAPPAQTPCAACQEQFCTFQINEINANAENFAAVDEVMTCAWSADWDEGAPAPDGACAQTGTRDCLCGPDQLDLLCQVTGGEGPCYDLFVEQTACDPAPAGQTVGQCTGNRAQNTDNPAGDAMQLVVCTRVNCVDACNVTPLL